MANEVTIPLLPCRDLDEPVAFHGGAPPSRRDEAEALAAGVSGPFSG